MLARLRVLLLFIVVIVAAPSHARAQQAGPMPASSTASASSGAGPRRDLTATAVRQITGAATTASAALAKQKNVGRPAALMIVGGAAIVLGLLMGEAIGTLFVVGGAVALLRRRRRKIWRETPLMFDDEMPDELQILALRR